MGTAVTKRNYYKEDPSQTTTTVTVEPSEESKSTSLSMPTNPALQQELQRQIQAAQRAYGVNPQTGAVTPFEALGYNPEEERKRREAERALNDRKRKENAWYNAFAVLGDSLTAALGGNVWQRQPNNIGAKANADNARLIAEQKAEDEGNAAKLRAAGTAYANTVNKLIQNYLTKTSTTTKTGGNRTEVTNNPGKSGYSDSTHVVGDGSNGGGSGSGGGGKSTIKTVKVQIKNPDGTIGSEDFHMPANDYDALGRYLSAAYNNLSQEGKNNINTVLASHNILPRDNGTGKNTYDGADLLSSGIVFDDPQIRQEFIKVIQSDESRSEEEKKQIIQTINEYPSEFLLTTTPEVKRSWWQRVKDWFSGNSQQTTRTTGATGRLTNTNPREGRR